MSDTGKDYRAMDARKKRLKAQYGVRVYAEQTMAARA